LLFNKFLPLSIYALVAKIQSDKIVRWCPDGEFLAIFLRPAFSASRVHLLRRAAIEKTAYYTNTMS